MSEPFKQQGVPGEVPGVVREDLPSPLLGRPDDSIPPTGLPALSVDGTGLQVNVPSSESINDLPLDAGSGHKGLHCPLPATESPDQSLSLSPGEPDLTRLVWTGSGYIPYRIVGDGLDLDQVVGEDRERSTVSDLGTPTATQGFQEEGDVPLSESLSPESLARWDEAANLDFVFLPAVPLRKKGV